MVTRRQAITMLTAGTAGVAAAAVAVGVLDRSPTPSVEPLGADMVGYSRPSHHTIQ